MTGEYRRQYCIVLDASCNKAPSKKKKKQQTTEHTEQLIEVALSVYVLLQNNVCVFFHRVALSYCLSEKKVRRDKTAFKYLTFIIYKVSLFICATVIFSPSLSQSCVLIYEPLIFL